MDRITQEAHFRQRVMEYYRKHGNATATANRYHISRKTFYKWYGQWDGTWESLKDRSRRPHNSPRAHTETELKRIRRLAKKHGWTDLILAFQEMREQYGYERSYGDANVDGKVTAADAAIILRSIVGLSTITKRGALNAEVDGDGSVTAADAAAILRYVVGLINIFPAQQP